MSDGTHQSEPWKPPRRSWYRKFDAAFRGVVDGIRGQNSFYVHIPMAIAVVIAAAVMELELVQWALLVICIGTVIAAELFNSSLEWISRAVTAHESHEIQRALDIASGAVLVVSLSAALVGTMLFAFRLGELMS